jgi:hypothetical protein
VPSIGGKTEAAKKINGARPPPDQPRGASNPNQITTVEAKELCHEKPLDVNLDRGCPVVGRMPEPGNPDCAGSQAHG